MNCTHMYTQVNATTAEHKALARKLAANGASLLKNDAGTLPVKAGAKGPSARTQESASLLPFPSVSTHTE